MHRPSLIFILAALSMLGALSIDAYIPAIPAIASHFEVSLPAVQQTLTVYLFAFAFMTLFYGTLSDSFGRRPVILWAMAVYFLSSLGAGLAPSLGWLLFFRLAQGLSAGAGSVVGRAIVGDLLKGAEAQRTMSYISMVFGLAPAIAPILGGWLQAAFGWRWVFGFIALFTILLLLACLRELPESLPEEQRHPFHFRVIVANYWSVARHAQFILLSLGLALTFSGIMFYIGSAPNFVLDILHLQATTGYGWLFIPLIGGMTLGSMVAGKISHTWSRSATIFTGYAVMAVSSLANMGYDAWFTVRIPWAVVPLATYSFGMALLSPSMMMTTLELFPKVRGLASSLQSFVFMIVFAVGSGVVCPLLFGSAFKLAAGVAAGMLLSLIFWLLGKRMASSVPKDPITPSLDSTPASVSHD